MYTPDRTIRLQNNEVVEIAFVKDPDDRWYVDFPEYQGDRADLEMVSGADNFLEIIGGGQGRITLRVCLKEFDGSKEVELVDNDCDFGKDYRIKEMNLDMWLCPVMIYTFGDFPDKFYISKKWT